MHVKNWLERRRAAKECRQAHTWAALNNSLIISRDTYASLLEELRAADSRMCRDTLCVADTEEEIDAWLEHKRELDIDRIEKISRDLERAKKSLDAAIETIDSNVAEARKGADTCDHCHLVVARYEAPRGV